MKPLRALWRLLRGLTHVLGGLFTILWRFPRLAPSHREARVQVWAAQLLAIWGVRLVVRGEVPRTGPVLLVANHISWLDIPVLHAARHCRFVSKADVKRWPLIGRMASAAGTLYIERESRRDALRAVHGMAQALRDGEVVAVFPEGTTSEGSDVLPFHANLLQAAIATDTPVLPVALQYLDARGRPTARPSYVGDDTLLGSIWRTLGEDVVAVVHFGVPQQAQGRDRRAWAADLREAVRALRQSEAPPSDHQKR